MQQVFIDSAGRSTQIKYMSKSTITLFTPVKLIFSFIKVIDF